MPRQMFRWAVPVDDEWHLIPIDKKPVMAEVVAATAMDWRVDVWAEKATIPGAGMYLRVFGTGHYLPDDVEHMVSAPRHMSTLVFHVYRRP